MKKKENGYLTVEASLVYPLIFCSLLFTISLSLYLYHVTVLRQISQVAVIRGNMEYEENVKIEKYVAEQIDELVKERLLFVTKYQKEVKVTQGKVRVFIKAKVNLPFLELPFMDFKWNEISVLTQIDRSKPVKIIRDVRKLYGS